MVATFAFYIVISLALVITDEAFGRLSPHHEAISHVIKVGGQTYDCVDFNKQPSFSHPLRKNMTYEIRSNKVPTQGNKASHIGLKDGGCPSGTVPILRYNNNALVVPQSNSTCFAGVQTKTLLKFFGAAGVISLNKPRVWPYQWSTSRIRLANEVDFIEAGWMVNPSIFTDSEAHLYARFSTAGQECINTQCPGFVQVSEHIPLGLIPDDYSIFGGRQFTWNLTIEKFILDGDWWLTLTGDQKVNIGYWTSNLFPSLKESAVQVQWGGEVANPRGISKLPSMGNGNKATFDASKSAFVQGLTIIDKDYQSLNPRDTMYYRDCEKDYSVLDFAEHGLDHLVVFGGPK